MGVDDGLGVGDVDGVGEVDGLDLTATTPLFQTIFLPDFMQV